MKRTVAILSSLVFVFHVSISAKDPKESDLEALKKERYQLRLLFGELGTSVLKDYELEKQMVDTRINLSDDDIKSLRNKIGALAHENALTGEVIKNVIQVMRRYGFRSVKDVLSDRASVRIFVQRLHEVNRELDRTCLLEQIVKHREETILERRKVVAELEERIMKLTRSNNRVALAKALKASVPDWEKTAVRLESLRAKLPEKRLADSVMRLDVFDKNADGIIDQKEMVKLTKAVRQTLDNAAKFGILVFDKDKNGKLSDRERFEKNRIFSAAALERLADMDQDGVVSDDEVALLVMTELFHFNALAQKYAGIIAKHTVPASMQPIKKKGSRSDYKIQSIKSANSMIIGRSNFTLPANLYGVGLPKDRTSQKQARDYLVKLLADNSYRIDHKSAGEDTKKTLALLEKLSNIIVTKVSFVDTRVTTVFEFLKYQSRNVDPEGEGVSFTLYGTPEPTPQPKKEKPKKKTPKKAGFDEDFEDDFDDGNPFVQDDQPLEPTVTLDLDNQSLGSVILAAARQTGSTIELENGMIFVRLPGAKPRKTQDTLLQLSLYLPKKGHTANYLLIRNGLARCTIGKAKTQVEKELAEAQVLAKKDKLGVWAGR